jgi:predicted NUDIX family phosphoesterase
MTEMVQTVKIIDLVRLIGHRPFVALPREEIDRLYAGVEVITVAHDQAEADPSAAQLVAFAVVHHNYTWLTLPSNGLDLAASTTALRSVGVAGHIRPEGNNGLFLDDSLKAEAHRVVKIAGIGAEEYTLRLAGLLFDDSTDVGRRHLCLVYIARLRQAFTNSGADGIKDISLFGTGVLQEIRDRFDSWSRILIDHLVAF